MQKVTLTAMTLLILLAIPKAALSGSITYDFQDYSADENGATLSGSITTDGQLGALAPSDILSWTLTITGATVVVNGHPVDVPPITASATKVDGNTIAFKANLVATPAQLSIAPGGSLGIGAAGVAGAAEGTVILQYDRTSGQIPYYSSEYEPFSPHVPFVVPWDTESPMMGGTDPWIVAAVPESSSLYLLSFGAVFASGYVIGQHHKARRTATTV